CVGVALLRHERQDALRIPRDVVFERPRDGSRALRSADAFGHDGRVDDRLRKRLRGNHAVAEAALMDDALASAGEAWALAQDAADPLAAFRDEFLIPPHGRGEQVYLCGNSLGLQPRATRRALNEELDDWAEFAVEAHFRGRHPWKPYHALVRDHLADVIGAQPGEVD